MNDEFIEFHDFVDDFFNIEPEYEIDEEFENAEEVILEEIDESEIVDESLFSFREIRENNPILGSLNERCFPLKIQELKKNQVGDKIHLLTGFDQKNFL